MEGGDLRMSGIDESIVRMTFDNKQFEQGVATTLSSLDKLKGSLKLEGATKGLDDVDKASKGLSFSSIANGVEDIADKFKTMSLIGIEAIQHITDKVVDAGIELAKAFVIDPIKDGFDNYETQINAVQTILANTASEGTKIQDVNKALADLNTYANQTVYNFSDMTKNIGTFTAAGVNLQTSVSSIKGIANLAALSGASAEQASGAMYQLSQAIAAGSVKLQDWNSVVNAGLGGKTFQDALVNTARAAGTNIDAIIKKAGSFRESLQEGWLTSNVLTKTLSQFTGDLSDAQIKAMGFTEKQAQQIMQLGQIAVDSATKIKTVTQLTDALKEEVATAYAAIFKTLFGDIGTATDLFTDLHNTLENALTNPIYALNTLLEGWDQLGGRKALIDGIKVAFQDLAAVLKPIKEAFSEMFPATTAKQLYDMTTTFRDFFERLKIGGTTADELKRTFAGLFAVLSIVWDVVKQGVKTLFDLVGMTTKGSGGFLEITAKVGDFLVQIKKTIDQGNLIVKFFKDLETEADKANTKIRDFLKPLKDIFDTTSKFDGTKAAKSLTEFVKKLVEGTDPLKTINEAISKVWKDLGTVFDDFEKKASPATKKLIGIIDDIWKKITDFFSDVDKTVKPWVQKAGDLFSQIGSAIAGAFNSIHFQGLLDGLDTGLFAALILLVRKVINKFKGSSEDEGGGIVDTFKEMFEGVTETLETMQNTLKAATLLEIAAAIGLLVLSIKELSNVNPQQLAASLGAITILFAQLIGSLYGFQKAMGEEANLKILLVAGALILLGLAIDTMAKAVKDLASLDWNGLARGLAGFTVILSELILTMKLMPEPEQFISKTIGIVILSGAIKMLVGAVKDLSGLSWEQLGKGLIGVGLILSSLVLFTKFADADTAGTIKVAGILLLARGIKQISEAMSNFAEFSWENIAKGLVSIGISLALITGAMRLMPEDAPIRAAGMLIISFALNMIGQTIQKLGEIKGEVIAKGIFAIAGSLLAISAALALLPPSSLLSAAAIFIVASSIGLMTDSLQKMGQMSWTAIGKSLLELAGSLAILAGGLYLMEGALPGAAALVIAAGALKILLPVLQSMGQMSWSEIGKSLVALAGAFIIIAGGALLLVPAVPVLLGFGAAVLLLGAGVLATGAGILFFATALGLLAAAGSAGTAAIVGIVKGLIGLIPQVMEEIGKGVIAFATVISQAGPAITSAITTVILSLVKAISNTAPQVIGALLSMLSTMLDELVKYVPHLVDAGLKLIIGLLTGIKNNIGQIVTVTVEIAVRFINGISAQLPSITQAGANLIIHFVNSLADTIRSNSKAMGQAGANLASAMIEGMVNGLAGGSGKIASEAENVAKSAFNAAKDFLQVNSPSKRFIELGKSANEGMAVGLTNFADMVKKPAENIGSTAMDSLKNSLSGMSTLISENIDTNPTITPVLDLSQVKKSAGQIGDYLPSNPVSFDATYSNAVGASNGYINNQITSTEIAGNNAKPPITFNQYNNSPVALSNADIYRQTKNQLSTARGALPI
jgi:tape measure domain-containing protein